MKKVWGLIFLLMAAVTASLSLAYAAGPVTSVDGASIRTTGVQGLRFYANVEDLESVHGFYLLYGDADVADLEAALPEMLHNGKTVFKAPVEGADQDGQFSVVLTGIPDRGYMQKITAIPYAVVDDEEVYGEPVTRSVAEVAQKMTLAGDGDAGTQAILNYVHNNYLSIESLSYGQYVVSGLYTADIDVIRAELVKDWNTRFGTSWVDLDASTFAASARVGGQGSQGSSTTLVGTNLLKFFQDETFGPKWWWLLEYMNAYGGGTIHPQRQAQALMNGGVNSTLATVFWGDHFVYAVYNLLKVDNKTGWSVSTLTFTKVDNTSIDRLYQIANYNNSIMKDLSTVELLPKGTQVTLPSSAELFTGYTNSNFTISGSTVTFAANYTLNNIVSLRVNRTAINYSIQYFDGDDALSLSPTSYTIASSEITLPIPVKDGYSFEGWYDNPSFDGSPITKISTGSTGNKVYHAKFEATGFSPVTITYQLNGGSLNNADTIFFKSTHNHTVTLFANSGNGSQLHLATAKIGIYWYHIALKPTAIAGVYEVTSKGTGSDWTKPADSPYVLAFHDSLATNKAAMQAFYNNASVGKHVVISGTIPASTSANAISLGIGLITNTSVIYQNVTYNYLNDERPFITPIKDGSTFGGWYTTPDFSGSAVETFIGLPSTVTLYAKWN
ncbi:InlB B-repeat-containing protein [Acholeplasma equirhinis]|uniref:InlB B-repeat-containing protein n=1 Tax=Acholeplasma equirhinis TaxID=555393 RepID=UPI00197ADEEB|nr:InlB B-repeat-containing protein [Acholeplasma equirhinis]MBN3490432.1 InlB B-repeat-containing protein [Acholeplasma equirhinis]